MKIVYILEQFYLHGGAEKITSTKINWLIKNNYELTLIVANQHNKPFIYNLNSKVTFIDLKINYIEGLSYFNLKNIKKAPKHFIKLKKTLKSINPDVVITLSLQFDYYFLPFITKAKTIREFHSSRHFYDKKREQSSFLHSLKFKTHDYIENKYTYNVVLTKDEKKHYKTDNVVVIPNGITAKTNIKSLVNNKIIIAAGRLAPVKNFEELFYIWQKINTKFPDWKLNIYGEGTPQYKNKLNQLIKKLEISNSCFLCGSTSKLNTKMQEASIYIMTSHTECYPMVLLEAKNIGLPIISYDCPYGPRNIISHNQDGLLIKNKNQNSFIEGLEKLILDKNLRTQFGDTAQTSVLNNQLDIIMKKWEYIVFLK